MANEFVHGTVGTSLTQAEFEAVGLHVFNSQARGDMPYASSTTQLSRLAIGPANAFLQTDGTDPVWRTGPTIADDAAFSFGGVASLLWETADANANALLLASPVGTATDVPVFVLGDANALNVDLGFFNGVTMPTLAVLNIARDAYISIDAGDDGIASARGIYFKAAADEDIEIINLSVTGTPRIYWDEATNVFRFTTGIYLAGADSYVATLNFITTGNALAAPNGNGAAALLQARDTDVNLVEIGRMAGAADPYFQIGRDDTGVALNAITDGLVLQMGGGTGNEAAGQGFGISVKIGNAASQVEERGQIDLRLVTATDGAEDTGWDFYTQAGGAANLAFKVDQLGELYGDADSTSGAYMAQNVNLFDDYDDAEELRRFQLTVPRTGLISEEQRLANRQRMVELGVFEENPRAHSGHMMKMQTMARLLAGGIWQTRQGLEDLRDELNARLAALGV